MRLSQGHSSVIERFHSSFGCLVFKDYFFLVLILFVLALCGSLVLCFLIMSTFIGMFQPYLKTPVELLSYSYEVPLVFIGIVHFVSALIGFLWMMQR